MYASPSARSIALVILQRHALFFGLYFCGSGFLLWVASWCGGQHHHLTARRSLGLSPDTQFPQSKNRQGVRLIGESERLSLCISPVTDWQRLQGKLCCSQQNNEPKTTQSFPTNIGRCEKIQERWIRRVPTVTRAQVTVGTLIVALKQKHYYWNNIVYNMAY